MNFLYTCDWMGHQLEKSSIFSENHKKFKLMIPVDETIFSPKKYIKENLKKFKCENKINFFFRSSYNKRKGITELIKILYKLIDLRKDFRKQIRLISIGDSFFQKKSNNLDIEYHNLGTIINENDLAEIYNISDLFISPSLEDVGPMMINEAIISGVPVISFDIGVAKDLIVENINGYIVKKDDYKMFANKLSMFLNLSKNKLSEMKKKSREIGLINTSNKTHIDEFKKIIIN
jgi:glycosyltransferase involved in cell wall biosynthesis